MRLSQLFLTCASVALLGSCQEKTSSLGADYFSDSLVTRTDTLIVGNGAISDSAFSVSTVSNGVDEFNLTYASPLMLLGRTTDADSWAVLQFPKLEDSLLEKVESVRLAIKTVKHISGDPASDVIAFDVYLTEGLITKSSHNLKLSDLPTTPYASLTTAIARDSSGAEISVSFDTAKILSHLKATSLGFVLVPTTTMTTIRGIGSVQADAKYWPKLIYVLRNGSSFDTVTKIATLDFHDTHALTQAPANEIQIMGSKADRVRFTLDITKLPFGLPEAYSTVNNAQLLLHLDPSRFSKSSVSIDSLGPSVINLRVSGGIDSSTYLGSGIRDRADPTLYRFQVRGLVEKYLRNPGSPLVVELRAGFAYRSFGSNLIGVEDYNTDLYTFYGSTSADVSKRPQFILTYSNLRR